MYFLIKTKKEIPNTTDFMSLLYDNNFIYSTTDKIYCQKGDSSAYAKEIMHTVLLNMPILEQINNNTKVFLNTHQDHSNWYQTFFIPKANGKKRRIDAPMDDLKVIQKLYSNVLSLVCPATEQAYAYVKNRSTLDMVKIHQYSKYVIKTDLNDFFGSCNKNFIKTQLLQIYSYNIINKKIPDFIDNMLEIATLDNVLPQGSALSPLLSNIVMIPIDYEIRNNNATKTLYYTRYADDMIFSSKTYISPKILLEAMKTILPSNLHLSREKTQVLKTTGRCYITGVKLNKDAQLTYGHEKKRKLKQDLFGLFKDYQDGIAVPEQVYELLGKFNYMRQIEPDYANYIERKFLKRFNSNAPTLTKYFKF